MDELEHLKIVVTLFDAASVLVCLPLVVLSVGLFFHLCLDPDADMPLDALYGILIILGDIVFTGLANLYIKYFGLPISLTFGYQIGKILPAGCEASLPIEGKDGLPCNLKCFMEWVGRATSGDGNWHWDELEGDWRSCIFYVGLMVVLSAGILIAVPCMKRRERRRLAEKDETGDEMAAILHD